MAHRAAVAQHLNPTLQGAFARLRVGWIQIFRQAEPSAARVLNTVDQHRTMARLRHIAQNAQMF